MRKEIYIRSTDKDRALQSAYTNLAGLYRPVDQQIWNASIKWQPIAVHSVVEADDFLIGSEIVSCLTYDKNAKNLMKTTEYKNKMTEYKAVLDYLSEHSGYPVNSTGAYSLLIRDILLIEKIYYKQLRIDFYDFNNFD